MQKQLLAPNKWSDCSQNIPKFPLQNKFYLICKMTYCVPAALHLFSSLCPRCSPHHHHRHRQLLTDQKGQLIWKSLLLLPTQIFLATASFFGTSSASSFHLNSELVWSANYGGQGPKLQCFALPVAFKGKRRRRGRVSSGGWCLSEKLKERDHAGLDSETESFFFATLQSTSWEYKEFWQQGDYELINLFSQEKTPTLDRCVFTADIP